MLIGHGLSTVNETNEFKFWIAKARDIFMVWVLVACWMYADVHIFPQDMIRPDHLQGHDAKFQSVQHLITIIQQTRAKQHVGDAF